MKYYYLKKLIIEKNFLCEDLFIIYDNIKEISNINLVDGEELKIKLQSIYENSTEKVIDNAKELFLSTSLVKEYNKFKNLIIYYIQCIYKDINTLLKEKDNESMKLIKLQLDEVKLYINEYQQIIIKESKKNKKYLNRKKLLKTNINQYLCQTILVLIKRLLKKIWNIFLNYLKCILK